MKDDMFGIILIETHNSRMYIGPLSFSEKLDDSFIKNTIRDVLTKNDCDFINMKEVTEIIVVFDCDDFCGLYTPKIEDVWPREFGYVYFIKRIIKKGGEK